MELYNGIPHNYLTISALKLDNVFADTFGKSLYSITKQLLQCPGETYDITPFVDNHCKVPIEEIHAPSESRIILFNLEKGSSIAAFAVIASSIVFIAFYKY